MAASWLDRRRSDDRRRAAAGTARSHQGPRPDHDHPGPRPDRRCAELVDGTLGGLLLDITGWTQDEVDTGVAPATELGQFGAGGRALYDPRPGEPDRWDWTGDTA